MNIKAKHIIYISLILTLFLTLGMISASEDNINQKVSLKEATNIHTTSNNYNIPTIKENNNEKIKNNNPTQITVNPKKSKSNIQKNNNKATYKKQKIKYKIILANKRGPGHVSYKTVGHGSELRYDSTFLKLWNPPETDLPLKIVKTQFFFKNLYTKKIIYKTIKKVYTEHYPAGNFATITMINKIKPYYKATGAIVYYKRV